MFRKFVLLACRPGERALRDRLQRMDSRSQSRRVARNAARLPSDLAYRRFFDIRVSLGLGNFAGMGGRRSGVSHGSAGPGSEDKSFQQGITGQTVRAMHPRARRFTRSEQSRHARAAFRVGADTAHRIVSRRMNRDRTRRNVDAMLQACLVDTRKSSPHKLGIHVRKIEVNVRVQSAASRPRSTVTQCRVAQVHRARRNGA